MTAQHKAETTTTEQHAAGFILLGLVLTIVGVVWLVARGGASIPLITGPICLIYGMRSLVRRGTTGAHE